MDAVFVTSPLAMAAGIGLWLLVLHEARRGGRLLALRLLGR